MENVAINARKKVTMENYFSQAKIVTPNNIAKLLSLSAKSVVQSTELVNNFLLVNGKVVVNAVYLSEENKVETTETSVDFVEKQKANFVMSELWATDEVKIADCSFSSSEVMCSIEHKTEVVGIFRYLVGDAGKAEDDFVLNTKKIECLNFLAACEDSFVVAEEVESNLKNIRILNIQATSNLTNVSATIDKIIIEGKIKLHALYDDENGLGEISREFEFKQEIACKNAMPDMHGEAVLDLTNATITEQEQEDKNRFAFVFDLKAKAYLFENQSVETYDDIFSLSKEIVPVYDVIELESFDGNQFETDAVLVQTDVSVYSDFDDLIGVYDPKVSVVSIEDNGEHATIYAEVSALAVYKTTNSINSFNLSHKTKFEFEKDVKKQLKTVKTTANVSSFKVKAGKDLDCTMFVDFILEYQKTSSENYVKSFELKQDKITDDAAVKVYVTRANQTLFDVAKAINLRPEVIAKQNEITDVFESGQKIYVYSPLNTI